MWGRAQRKATRRCASDWGHSLWESRVKIPLVATSRVPNAVTLAYTVRAMLIVAGSTFASIRRVEAREKVEGRGEEGRISSYIKYRKLEVTIYDIFELMPSSKYLFTCACRFGFIYSLSNLQLLSLSFLLPLMVNEDIRLCVVYTRLS